jgi:fructosamine-3-kinase
MSPALKAAIENAIQAATDEGFTITSASGTGGGCINETFLLSDGHSRFFLKLNAASAQAMFCAEAEALETIRQTETLYAPAPIAQGQAEGRAFLVLEAIEFGTGTDDSWQQMGRKLAELHQHASDQFGWNRDNTIGSTPQYNAPNSNWATFFREQRLRPQLELARLNGYHFARAEALLNAAEILLAKHHPKASLLHGDLWSGNVGFSVEGTPIIYDPASYYGDRETDLAFSEFFGGFPLAFYESYQNAWPLAAGYEARKNLYNLYHVLNHANLFGGGYIRQAENMIAALTQQ